MHARLAQAQHLAQFPHGQLFGERNVVGQFVVSRPVVVHPDWIAQERLTQRHRRPIRSVRRRSSSRIRALLRIESRGRMKEYRAERGKQREGQPLETSRFISPSPPHHSLRSRHARRTLTPFFVNSAIFFSSAVRSVISKSMLPGGQIKFVPITPILL